MESGVLRGVDSGRRRPRGRWRARWRAGRCLRGAAHRPGDAVLNVGDRRRQHRGGPVDVALGGIDCVEQRPSLSERRLRGSHGVHQFGLLARDRARRQLAGAGDVLVGERQALLCLGHVAGHRSQSGAVEFVSQRLHLLLRRRDPRRDVHQLLGQRVQLGGRVDHQVAQLLERLLLRVQFSVRRGGGDDDAGQQIPSLGRRLGYRVVELLPNPEGLRQSSFGIVDGAGERLGSAGAELLDGERQFVVAGADRVVNLYDLLPGQIVERVERHRSQRVGVCRVHPVSRGELGGASASSAPAHQDQQRRQGQHDHTDDDGQCRPRHLLPEARGVQAVRRGDGGSAPVAVAQCGLDLVRCRSPTSPALMLLTVSGTRNAYARSTVATASSASEPVRSLVRYVFEPSSCDPRRRSRRRRPPTAGSCGRCRACRSRLDICPRRAR